MPEKMIEKMITDGIQDQHGRKWLCFGKGDTVAWIATSELHTLTGPTLAKLERVGVSVITTAAKEALKREAQAFESYRPASLADRPGWSNDTYILGDGTHHTLRAGTGDPIIAFEVDPRFSTRGNLQAYLDTIGPLTRDQPLLLFVLAFGYVGPLLRFAPPHMQNPVVELVGKTEQGKSSLAQAASSIWGGDPQSNTGICESWNFSPGKLDELRAGYRHGLLVLDEANKAGDTEAARAKVIGDTIFKLADTDPRKRFGDAEPPPPVRQAVLSTSNRELRLLVGTSTETQQAVITRVLTLLCDRGHGVFDSVPDGYADARAAVEALMDVSIANAGAAGHSFIAQLCSHSERKLRKAVAQGLALEETQSLALLAPDARTSRIIAITFVAARIALQFGVLPRPACKMDGVFRGLFQARKTLAKEEPNALQLLRTYVADHRDELIRISDERLPLSESDFEAAPGVWDENANRLIISTKHQMIGIHDKDAFLRELRTSRRLSSETGVFSKKTPRRICNSGRAYFIDSS